MYSKNSTIKRNGKKLTFQLFERYKVVRVGNDKLNTNF